MVMCVAVRIREWSEITFAEPRRSRSLLILVKCALMQLLKKPQKYEYKNLQLAAARVSQAAPGPTSLCDRQHQA